MGILQLRYDEFIALVQMSKLPHILLEGRSDEMFFRRMCEAMTSPVVNANDVNSRVAITSAEELSSDKYGEGNREKVIKVTELMQKQPCGERFVGFVDREFRKFTFLGVVFDELNTHYRHARLVWSRGHSVENYCFDFEVVKDILLDSSPNQSVAHAALGILQKDFVGVLNIGCALGLTGYRRSLLDAVRRTVDWRNLRLSNSKFVWDTAKWSDALVKHTAVDREFSRELVKQFEHALEITTGSSLDDVRWACDGHIGLSLIWSAYARAVYDIAAAEDDITPNPGNQASVIWRTDNNIKFNLMARSWAQLRARDSGNSPNLCLGLIGLHGVV